MSESNHAIDVRVLGKHLVLFLLSLSFIIPTHFTLLKSVMLFGLLLFIIILYSNKAIISVQKDIFLLSLFYSFIGILWCSYGVVNNNPGAISNLSLMVVYPLLFTGMAVFLTLKDFHAIENFLIISSLLIISLQIVFILSGIGYLPAIFFDILKNLNADNDGLSASSTYLVFSLPNVSSLFFLIPFLTAKILLSKKTDLKLFVLLLIMVILILLSGRRAFFLSYGLSISVLVLLLSLFEKDIGTNARLKLVKIIFFLISLISILFFFTEINIQNYVENFFSIFDFSSNYSNIERANQLVSLLEGIYQAPLFGHGAGASASYIRSVEQPWAYELSYVAFVFQYGVLGLILYFSGLLYIIINMLKMSQDLSLHKECRVFLISFMIGLVSFLIANATNPYLAKFDYMWIIFIPVMLINSYKLKRDIA